MPKPAHCKVTYEGVIGDVAAPVEHWSFSVNFPRESLDADGNQTVDDALAAQCKDAFDALLPILPSDTILTSVKVARVGGDGHVEKRADGSYAQGLWVGSRAGAGAQQPVPLQVAMCVSLNTLRSGSSGKGRFFLPWVAKPIAWSDKRLTPADTQIVANDSATFLNSLATVMTFPPQVVSSKGFMSEVVSLRVGRVPDTMRSRREDNPEGYVSAPLA